MFVRILRKIDGNLGIFTSKPQWFKVDFLHFSPPRFDTSSPPGEGQAQRYTSPERKIPSRRLTRVPPTGEDGETLPETPGADETIVDGPPDIIIPSGGSKQKKVYVDGVGATIIAERVEYLDENGKLVTESLRDFTKKALKKRFASLDDFLRRWKTAERKQAIVEELEGEGLPLIPSPRNWATTLPRKTPDVREVGNSWNW